MALGSLATAGEARCRWVDEGHYAARAVRSNGEKTAEGPKLLLHFD